jgi:hypothetical protein
MTTTQNMIFSVEGVHVSSDHVCNEKFCTIHLDNLSNDSSGAYRCEVSGDAPEFKLVHETSNMTVAGEFVFDILNFMACFNEQPAFYCCHHITKDSDGLKFSLKFPLSQKTEYR